MKRRGIIIYPELLSWPRFSTPALQVLLTIMSEAASRRRTKIVMSVRGLARQLSYTDKMVRVAIDQLRTDGIIATERAGRLTAITVLTTAGRTPVRFSNAIPRAQSASVLRAQYEKVIKAHSEEQKTDDCQSVTACSHNVYGTFEKEDKGAFFIPPMTDKGAVGTQRAQSEPRPTAQSEISQSSADQSFMNLLDEIKAQNDAFIRAQGAHCVGNERNFESSDNQIVIDEHENKGNVWLTHSYDPNTEKGTIMTESELSDNQTDKVSEEKEENAVGAQLTPLIPVPSFPPSSFSSPTPPLYTLSPLLPPMKKKEKLSCACVREGKGLREIEKIDFEQIRDMFNATFAGTKIPPVERMSAARRRLVEQFVADYGLDAIPELFRRVAASSSLMSTDKVNRRTSFSWILMPRNYDDIMDGNYDNVPVQGQRPPRRPQQPQQPPSVPIPDEPQLSQQERLAERRTDILEMIRAVRANPNSRMLAVLRQMHASGLLRQLGIDWTPPTTE